jgi:hypothetical protein
MMRFFPHDSSSQPVLIMTDQDEPDCAWCMDEEGKEHGEGSHGICARHATLVLARYREQKAARAKHRH